MGIVTPEQQMIKVSRRLDDWIQHDLEAVTKLEFEQHCLSKNMQPGSIEHKDLFYIYHYPHKMFFKPSFCFRQLYCKEKYVVVGVQLLGHTIIYAPGDGVSTRILLGD